MFTSHACDVNGALLLVLNEVNCLVYRTSSRVCALFGVFFPQFNFGISVHGDDVCLLLDFFSF